MAHVFDTSLYNTGTGNPQAFNFTPGAGSTLLVLGINVAGATDRTNFATAPPTFGGIPMKIVHSSEKAVTSPEIISELWYHLNPSTGAAYSISVPNAATSKTLYLRAATFEAQAGYTSVFCSSIGGNGTSANPTLTLSASDGGVIVGAFGSGYASLPTAYNGLPIRPVDHGALNSVVSYKLITANGNASLGYTQVSDDWGLVIGSWSEQLDHPAQIVLNKPINTAIVSQLDPSVSWVIAPTADSYWLKIDNNNDFSSPVYDVSGLTDIHYDLSSLDYSTNYYWKVAGINAAGMGPYSAARSFRTWNPSPDVSLNSPSDSATSQSTTPALLFTGIDLNNDSIEYEVQVDTSTGFNSVAGSSVDLKYVDLGLFKIGSPTDNIFVEIRSDSLTGTILGTSDSLVGSTLTTTSTQKRFTFSTPVTLSAGTQYWLRVNRSLSPDDATNYYMINGNYQNPYAGGNYGYTTTSVSGTDMSLILTNSDNTIILSIIANTSNLFGLNSGYDYVWQSFTTEGTANAPLLDKLSSIDVSDFTAGHPFDSSTQITFTDASALNNDTTYYWKVRGIDPTGSNVWGAWSDIWSFTTGASGGGRVYGGILKYWDGGSWVECPSTQLKIYNGADWAVCPSMGFKVFVDNDWFPVRREG